MKANITSIGKNKIQENFFMDSTLSLINRKNLLFEEDISDYKDHLNDQVSSSSFLVIGAAGTIGQAVSKEIFKRNPRTLHCVDISENNLVELVRDIRSQFGYIKGDFQTFSLDCGSIEFEAFFNQNSYDFILNLSALKHVRSEKDPYTLMRLVEVNILNTIKTINLARENGCSKYFCVSTDKATNPVNMMGASKRIMEMFLMDLSSEIEISTARFANVAFSDGSLMHSFKKRMEKLQPIAAPDDIKRYFITKSESGQLCLLSTILGKNRDIFFPKLKQDFDLMTFSSIASSFLAEKGFEAVQCVSEHEARQSIHQLIPNNKWPCFFSKSDTTGEKDFEEFYSSTERLDLDRFKGVGVVKNNYSEQEKKLSEFLAQIKSIRKRPNWTKKEILETFTYLLPKFSHDEKNRYLDQKM